MTKRAACVFLALFVISPMLMLNAGSAVAAPSQVANSPGRLIMAKGSAHAVYAPIGGHWSKSYKGVNYIDTNVKKPQHYVGWWVAPFSSGSMCVRVKGHRWSDGKAYWRSLGCGKSGGGYVHTGKSGYATSGTDYAQAKSLNVVTGVPGYFN